MFGRSNINGTKMGKILNDWVYQSVKQIFFNDRELAGCGFDKNDDVFYELNSAYLFIIVNLLTKTDYNRKQNIIDEMHNQNIDMLIKLKYFAANEIIDYRRCLSQTYKENSKIMKTDNGMEELSKSLLVRTEGRYEDETAVSVLTSKLAEFYSNTAKLLDKYKEKQQ